MSDRICGPKIFPQEKSKAIFLMRYLYLKKLNSNKLRTANILMPLSIFFFRSYIRDNSEFQNRTRASTLKRTQQ